MQRSSERVTIPAALWCPEVGVALRGGAVLSICALRPYGALVMHMREGAVWDEFERLSIPLDVPANLLGVLRTVWAKVTGEDAPLLLVLSQAAAGYWRLHGPGRPQVLFFPDGGPTYGRWCAVPALDGITDPLRAAAVIAEAVLGGEA